MSKLFNSDEEKDAFACDIQYDPYGIHMLLPAYVNKRKKLVRLPADEHGNRERSGQGFSREELVERMNNVAEASCSIRVKLEHIGVSKILLESINDEQLYYYALGISDA